MGKDPAVLFYTSDFLTGTSRFSDEQTGQYIRALCNQHQGGHFTKEELLSFIKSEDSPVMKKFEIDSSGLYFNERMDIEKEKRSNYSASRSKNIGSRWGKNDKPLSGKKINSIHMNNICSTHVIHMENENDNEIKDVIKSNKEGMQGESAPESSPSETMFELFRKEYPGTKRGLKTEYDNFRKKHGDHKTILPLLSTALSNQKQWRQEMAAAGMFVPEWPGLAVWINQRRWENEKPVIENKKNNAIPQCDFQRKAVGKYDNLPKASN